MRLFTQTDGTRATRSDPSAMGDEFEFETVLYRNPDLILDEPLLVFGRQYATSSGRPDLLALDQYGNVVVIEIKQGSSGTKSASESSIISQPVQYAEAMKWYDLEDLEGVYQELRSEYSVPSTIEDAEELTAAFEAVFGSPIPVEDYNTNQRLVIVAETITEQTARNARFLLEEGVNIQCVQVRRFATGGSGGEGEGETTLVTSPIVDYDLKRVESTPPTYPDVARDVFERAFPTIAETVEAESLHEVLDGLESYEPGIRSNASAHPDAVKYTLHLRPRKWSMIVAAIENPGRNPAVLEALEDHAETFEDEGFSFEGGVRDRLVTAVWKTDDPARLADDDFRDELADRFAALVQVGHEVFEAADVERTP